MDSLTQIVLGAAVGEVVLGKKIGNKAILYGAIAGTIPDLDVLARSLFDPLTANELHRGPTHSILFCLLAAPLFGAWVKRHQQSFVAVFALLIGLVFMQGGRPMSTLLVLGTITVGVVVYLLWKARNRDHATWQEWSWLFWWSLVTHPFLDCHTTWGTQLLWPLPLKVAYNNIFVVDPFYTVPFLVCVIIAMNFKRADPRRRRINMVGIWISSAYMLLTLFLKYIAFDQIRDSLLRQEIVYESISTRPTPFNSILWTANIDSGDRYHIGLHSLLDTKPEVEVVPVLKSHELLGKYTDHNDVKRLAELTENNYVIRLEGDTIIFNDLRFGQMGDPQPDKPFVFSYRLVPNGDDLDIELIPPSRLKSQEMGAVFSELMERIKGE